MGMSKRHLQPVPPSDDDELVPMLIPRRWMGQMQDNLEQLKQQLRDLLTMRPMAQVQAPYMSYEEVAEMTGFSTKTVRRWVKTGKLQGCGPAGCRFKRAEVEALMASFPKTEGEDDRELAEVRARLHNAEE